MRLRTFAVLAPAGLLLVGLFLACSSGEVHPDAGTTDRAGDGGFADANLRPADSGPEASTGDGGDTDAGAGCTNNFKDGLETDTDCGGTVCGKCVDGKACIADSDCAGNACVSNVCKTATCTDGVKNGSESDVDCGGTVCPKCTIGKACAAGGDCSSNACGNNQCACPVNMAIVARTNGTSYCVDTAEVTKGQYNKFISATVPVTTQPPVCAGNTNFVPGGAWPPLQTPDGIAFSYAMPVHYVDWCDGYAYCRWAGKQLCGQINGGPVPTTELADAGASAWYNACSAQGQKAWPYSTIYAAGQCNVTGDGGAGVGAAAGGYGYGGVNQDEGVYTVANCDLNGNIGSYADPGGHGACLGGSVNLYQMSGNVAEWEDSCSAIDGGVNDQCRLRGGSYTANGDSTQVRCDADRMLERVPTNAATLKDVGFRCCVY
jgi:formylglycine-generating enzyme required for sulfatase activity